MPISYTNDTDFIEIGPPKWGKGGWGLDSLRLKYQGGRAELDAFLASLVDWEPSALDGGMYLDTFANDDDPVQPTVDVSYIGRRGGVLPEVQTKQGFTLQTASFQDSGDGALQLDVLYRSPNTSMSWIGTSDAMTYSGFTNPGEIVVVQRRVNGHLPILFRYADAVRNSLAYARATDEQRARIDAFLEDNQGLIDAAADRLIAFFNSLFITNTIVTDFTAVELVPGEYYQCTSTTSEILEGI